LVSPVARQVATIFLNCHFRPQEILTWTLGERAFAEAAIMAAHDEGTLPLNRNELTKFGLNTGFLKSK